MRQILTSPHLAALFPTRGNDPDSAPTRLTTKLSALETTGEDAWLSWTGLV